MEEPEMPCPNTHLDGKGRELRLPLSWVDAFRKMSQTASDGIFFVRILDPGALVVKWCIQSHRVGKGRKRNHALGVPLAGVFSTSWCFHSSLQGHALYLSTRFLTKTSALVWHGLAFQNHCHSCY